MKLRLATVEDAPALAIAHAAAFEAPWPQADIAALLDSPGVVGWLVEGDGPEGMALVRVVAGEAEILTLGVAPSARRRGVGAALVSAAVVVATARGGESLFLEVAADNAAAQALYAAADFVPAGRRAGYYRRPDGAAIDALVLRRALNSDDA